MSKDSRLKKNYRESASQLHMSMGELLRNSEYFKGYRTFQEYPVNRISSYFDSGREKFDWVILDLGVIIEMMGEFHYKAIVFPGVSKEMAKQNLKEQQERDEAKRKAAEEAGWTYVTFKYDEDITEQALLDKIANFEPKYSFDGSIPERPLIIGSAKITARVWNSDKADKYREQQKQYRKEQYQRAKAWKKSREE